MDDRPIAADEASDPLRLSECPTCRYSLQGLPAEGVCPECGSPYDQATVVLYGWARGERATLSNSGTAAAVAQTAFWAFLWWLLFRGDIWSAASLVGFSILVGLPALVAVWSRWRVPGAELAQVRFSAEGCAQHDTAELAYTPVRWLLTVFVEFLQFAYVLLPVAYILFLAWKATGRYRWALLVGCVGVACAGMLAVRLWRRRTRRSGTLRARQLLRTGNAVPWTSVGVPVLKPVARNRHRIRCTMPRSFVHGTTVVIDAVVTCTDEQAAALRQRLETWSEAARAVTAQERTGDAQG
jgi:hypothetical protein